MSGELHGLYGGGAGGARARLDWQQHYEGVFEEIIARVSNHLPQGACPERVSPPHHLPRTTNSASSRTHTPHTHTSTSDGSPALFGSWFRPLAPTLPITLFTPTPNALHLFPLSTTSHSFCRHTLLQ